MTSLRHLVARAVACAVGLAAAACDGLVHQEPTSPEAGSIAGGSGMDAAVVTPFRAAFFTDLVSAARTRAAGPFPDC